MHLFKIHQVVNVAYVGTVDCDAVNIFHTRKMAAGECNYLKRATPVDGSAGTGNTCSYMIWCNPGNVTCTMEIAITDPDVEFSLCEIELWTWKYDQTRMFSDISQFPFVLDL